LAVSETVDGGATRPLPRDGGTDKFCKGPNIWATPQSLDQRSKMEVVPKMVHQSRQIILAEQLKSAVLFMLGLL